MGNGTAKAHIYMYMHVSNEPKKKKMKQRGISQTDNNMYERGWEISRIATDKRMKLGKEQMDSQKTEDSNKFTGGK